MGQSIGELLANPVLYWHWFNDEAARVAAIHAVHDLDLLDHIGPAPTSAAEIAERSGLDPDLVRRLVEFLAAERVLDVDEEGNFLPTEQSRLLATLEAVSWAHGTLLRAALRMGEAIRNGDGRNAWTIAHGKSLFEALGANPDWGRMFGEAMSFSTAVTEPKIFELHQFEPFKVAVDVGGSHGNLMMRLLGDHPDARGIVFDLPETAERAREVVGASDMADRIEIVAGNFCEKVPEGGDLYLLKHILHDWNDAESVAIMKTIRAAMEPGARLAVIERIVPDEYRPDIAYSYDIVMLLCASGQERRVADFEAMFEEAGFRLDRVTDNPGGVSVLEAVAV